MEFFMLLLLVLYFLPSLIALLRAKRNKIAIFALNFFLGWTLLGWVISLVWALTKDGIVLQQSDSAHS